MAKTAKVVPLYEAGLRVFGKGQHSPNPPNRTGVFPVWARDGSFRGWASVTVHNGKLVYQLGNQRSTDPTQVHVGWWWSKALPALPAAPHNWDAQMTEFP